MKLPVPFIYASISPSEFVKNPPGSVALFKLDPGVEDCIRKGSRLLQSYRSQYNVDNKVVCKTAKAVNDDLEVEVFLTAQIEEA